MDHDDWGHWPDGEHESDYPNGETADLSDLELPGYPHGHDESELPGYDHGADTVELGEEAGPDDGLDHGFAPDLTHETDTGGQDDTGLGHGGLDDGGLGDGGLGHEGDPAGHAGLDHELGLSGDEHLDHDAGTDHDGLTSSDGGHEDGQDHVHEDGGHDSDGGQAGDDPWQHDFPPALELADRPVPVDGYPWSDPLVLGDPGAAHLAAAQYGTSEDAPSPSDLYDYAGLPQPAPGTDGWAALLDSDDPATSALARWWGPATS